MSGVWIRSSSQDLPTLGMIDGTTDGAIITMRKDVQNLLRQPCYLRIRSSNQDLPTLGMIDGTTDGAIITMGKDVQNLLRQPYYLRIRSSNKYLPTLGIIDGTMDGTSITMRKDVQNLLRQPCYLRICSSNKYLPTLGIIDGTMDGTINTMRKDVQNLLRQPYYLWHIRIYFTWQPLTSSGAPWCSKRRAWSCFLGRSFCRRHWWPCKKKIRTHCELLDFSLESYTYHSIDTDLEKEKPSATQIDSWKERWLVKTMDCSMGTHWEMLTAGTMALQLEMHYDREKERHLDMNLDVH